MTLLIKDGSLREQKSSAEHLQERGLHFHENFDIDEETRFSSVASGKGIDDSGYDENEDILVESIFNLASHHSPTISKKDTLGFGANSTCQAYTKTPNFSSWNCMQCLQAECAFFSSSSGEIKSKGVTMTALLAKPTSLALVKHPVVNSSCRDGNSFTYNSNINIAVAIAIEGGLITLVLQDADKVDVYTLSRKWKELVDKARAKQLQPHEYNTG
ncbi:dihydrolipoyllysine-residue acetyltransferase component of pyruvate dehydrogenase complex, mitochondrial-like [Arachis hypogaea]|uniref:dihydrolipoyllysine-residue acetyltransferase component of pyruvate dehydrogenase complex, mitochondrial-like n=1 Tax=Arachis hypogaea TaxID=3818 RepID=UPI003B21097C